MHPVLVKGETEKREKESKTEKRKGTGTKLGVQTTQQIPFVCQACAEAYTNSERRGSCCSHGAVVVFMPPSKYNKSGGKKRKHHVQGFV